MFGYTPPSLDDLGSSRVTDEPIHQRRNLVIMGFILPIALLIWGLVYVITGSAWIPDRNGLDGIVLRGLTAVAFGLCFICMAIMMHCWFYLCLYEKTYLLGLIISGMSILVMCLSLIYVVIQVAYFANFS